MAGCVIFTDPLDDGEVTEKNGYEAYPSKRIQPGCIPVLHGLTWRRRPGAQSIVHTTRQRQVLLALFWRSD
jgi:hypothetical protein